MWPHLIHISLFSAGFAASAIAAAPFILPSLGFGMPFGDTTLELDVALNKCSSGNPTGIAGWSSNALSHLPWAGETLSKGGIANAIAAGGTLWAGTAIAKKIEDKTGEPGWLSWGGAIRLLTMATTALIALPALLPALSMGIDYLSLLAGNHFYGDLNAYNNVAAPIVDTLGKLGREGSISMSGGVTTATASSFLLPHLLACGVGIAGAGFGLAKGAKHIVTSPEHSVFTKEIQHEKLLFTKNPAFMSA